MKLSARNTKSCQVGIGEREQYRGVGRQSQKNLFGVIFKQTASDRSQAGLGIGLSLVKGLIEMHGGKIEAHSEGPGRGSEFVVPLPMVSAEPLSESHAAKEDGDGASTAVNYRILIVDDNRLSSESTAMALRLMGHDVATARDGIEGIECVRTFRPDVILLDIGLPGLNGYDTARRIREQPWGESLFLIAVTGYGQDEDRRRSLEAGFDHHLVKPLNFTDLKRKLAELTWSRNAPKDA